MRLPEISSSVDGSGTAFASAADAGCASGARTCGACSSDKSDVEISDGEKPNPNGHANSLRDAVPPLRSENHGRVRSDGSAKSYAGSSAKYPDGADGQAAGRPARACKSRPSTGPMSHASEENKSAPAVPLPPVLLPCPLFAAVNPPSDAPPNARLAAPPRHAARQTVSAERKRKRSSSTISRQYFEPATRMLVRNCQLRIRALTPNCVQRSVM